MEPTNKNQKPKPFSLQTAGVLASLSLLVIASSVLVFNVNTLHAQEPIPSVSGITLNTIYSNYFKDQTGYIHGENLDNLLLPSDTKIYFGVARTTGGLINFKTYKTLGSAIQVGEALVQSWEFTIPDGTDFGDWVSDVTYDQFFVADREVNGSAILVGTRIVWSENVTDPTADDITISAYVAPNVDLVFDESSGHSGFNFYPLVFGDVSHPGINVTVFVTNRGSEATTVETLVSGQVGFGTSGLGDILVPGVIPSGLDGGESIEIDLGTFGYDPNRENATLFYYDLSVDPNDLILETDETNNEASGAVETSNFGAATYIYPQYPEGDIFVGDEFNSIVNLVPEIYFIDSGEIGVQYDPALLEYVDHQRSSWNGSVLTQLDSQSGGVLHFGFTIDTDNYPTGGVFSLFTITWKAISDGSTRIDILWNGIKGDPTDETNLHISNGPLGYNFGDILRYVSSEFPPVTILPAEQEPDPNPASGFYVSSALAVADVSSDEVIASFNRFESIFQSNGGDVAFVIQFLDHSNRFIYDYDDSFVPLPNYVPVDQGKFYYVGDEANSDPDVRLLISRFTGDWLSKVAEIRLGVLMSTPDIRTMQPTVASLSLSYTLDGITPPPPGETVSVRLKLIMPFEGNLYDYETSNSIRVVIVEKDNLAEVIDNNFYPVTINAGQPEIDIPLEAEAYFRIAPSTTHNVWAKGKYHLATATEFDSPAAQEDGVIDTIELTLEPGPEASAYIGDIEGGGDPLHDSFNFINAQDWTRFIFDYFETGTSLLPDFDTSGRVDSLDWSQFIFNYFEKGADYPLPTQ